MPDTQKATQFISYSNISINYTSRVFNFSSGLLHTFTNVELRSPRHPAAGLQEGKEQEINTRRPKMSPEGPGCSSASLSGSVWRGWTSQQIRQDEARRLRLHTVNPEIGTAGMVLVPPVRQLEVIRLRVEGLAIASEPAGRREERPFNVSKSDFSIGRKTHQPKPDTHLGDHLRNTHIYTIFLNLKFFFSSALEIWISSATFWRMKRAARQVNW